jgi:hypothetical protein
MLLRVVSTRFWNPPWYMVLMKFNVSPAAAAKMKKKP